MPISPSRPPAPPQRALVVALVTVLLLISACSDTSSTTQGNATASGGATEPEAPPRPEVFDVQTFGIGSVTEERVDDSRPTKAHGGAPELPQRTLPVTVYYPADEPWSDTVMPDAEPSGKGPFPLLVFSHGVGAFGTAYQAKLQTIASAGYVVAAPTYPLGSNATPGGATLSDIDQQAGDVSFLLDEYTEESSGPLAGLVDRERLGAFGHSMGGITSLGVGFQDCCVDERLDAVAEWSGLFMALDDDGSADLAEVAADRPVLIVHGDKDPIVPYVTGRDFYEKAPGPKYFVTLPGEGHVVPFVAGLGSPANNVTALTTIGFFDRYLKDDPGGIERLEAAVEAEPGIAVLESVADA